MFGKKAKTRTAMLVINGEDAATAGSAAVIAILNVKNHEPATYQEALRTLAVVGRPPQNVSIANCNFKG